MCKQNQLINNVCVYTHTDRKRFLYAHTHKMCVYGFYTNIHIAGSATLDTEKVGSWYICPSLSRSNWRNVSQKQWATKYNAKPLTGMDCYKLMLQPTRSPSKFDQGNKACKVSAIMKLF